MKYLSFLLFSFLIGIIIGDIWTGSGIYITGLVALVLLVWSPRYVWWSIICLGIGFWYAAMTYAGYIHERQRVGDLVGWDMTTHVISGEAQTLLNVSEFSHRYRVSLTALDDTPQTPLSVVMTVPPNLSMISGDAVSATGRFDFPRDTEDYLAEKQLWQRGMVTEFHTFHMTKTPPSQYGFFTRLHAWFDDRLATLFPRMGHSLLSGILLGQRTDMEPDLKQALKNSGLMHLMVVSGGNVIMLIVFLSLFIRSLPVCIRISIVLITIGSFVLLVGGDAPVWRAAMMGVIGYAGSLWGYRFPRFVVPLGVACILAVINPLSIAYDIGLQLSFLSVMCIIAFGKQLTRFFGFLGDFFAEAMAMTVAATLGTLPITIYYFGTFSVVGPIANLFAAPAIPVLMYGGIGALFASTISETLAVWIGYIPWIATTYLYRVIHLFGDPAWAQMTISLGVWREEFLLLSLGLLTISIVYFSRIR